MENTKKMILQALGLTLLFLLFPLLARLIHYSFSGFIVLALFFAAFAFISFCRVLNEKYLSAAWKTQIIHMIISVLVATALGSKSPWGAGIGLAAIAIVLILSPRFLGNNVTEEMKE